MKKPKYIFYATLALMAGCAPLDFLIGEPGVQTGAMDVISSIATNSGNPPFVVAGLVVSTLAAIARGIYHKRTTKEVVLSVQAGYNKLTADQRNTALKEVSKHMPDKVKKVVAKIKASV